MNTSPSCFINETYRFIRSEILSILDWREFSVVLASRQKERVDQMEGEVDILPILACIACDGNADSAIPVAASWSLYILAGRIFDDIQDGEGDEHCWHQNGVNQALSMGLYALGAANLTLSHLSHPLTKDVVQAFSKVLAFSAQAQCAHSQLVPLTLDTYFDVIVSKTAIAFATAVWAGARLATSSNKLLTRLHQYGLLLGTAIQIEDDCVDLQVDLQNGLYTLPVLYALEQREHHLNPHLKYLLSSKAKKQGNDVQKIIAILGQMGAIDWAYNMAQNSRQHASKLVDMPSIHAQYLTPFALGNRLS